MTTATKPPWWQMTRTPTAGFALAGLWSVAAVLRWWDIDVDDRLALLSAVLFTLLAATYLASTVAQVRRARTDAAAAGDARAADDTPTAPGRGG